MITDVDEVVQAVKIRLPDEPNLVPAMKEIQFQFVELRTRTLRDNFWPFRPVWHFLHLFDPRLNDLTRKLSDAVQNIKLVRLPSPQRQTMSGHPDLWLTS